MRTVISPPAFSKCHSVVSDSATPFLQFLLNPERTLSQNENLEDEDLVVAPENFVDPSAYSLFIDTTGVMLQSRRVSHDDVPPHSP